MSANPASFMPPNRPPMADQVRADFAPILSKYGARHGTAITALANSIAADPQADQPTTPATPVPPSPPVVVGPSYVPPVPDLLAWLAQNQVAGKTFDLQPKLNYNAKCGQALAAPGMTLNMHGAVINGFADPNPDPRARSSSLFALAIGAANFTLDASDGGTITADPSFVALRAIFVRALGFVVKGLTVDLLTTGIQFAPTAGQAQIFDFTTTPNLVGDGIYIGGGDTYAITRAVILGSKTQHCIRCSSDNGPGHAASNITITGGNFKNVGNETLAFRDASGVMVVGNDFDGWVRFGQADADAPKNVHVQGIHVTNNRWHSVRSPQLAFYQGCRDGHALNNAFAVDATTTAIHVQNLSEVEVSGNQKIAGDGVIPAHLLHAFGSPVLTGTDAGDVLR